jgi:hypothetical protein
MKHPTTPVAIGNGLFAQRKLSLWELYKAKQRACPHVRIDPRGFCYACGAKQIKEAK